MTRQCQTWLADQWGVPDWHDGTAYPDPRTPGFRKSAYEFFRRNNSYRVFWQQMVDPYRQRGEDLPPGTINESIRLFGLASCPDPRLEKPTALLWDALYLRPSKVGGEFKIDLAPNQVAIVFRLDCPIGPQIEFEREWLTSLQRDLEIPNLLERRRRDKFVVYLRVLDGVDAGASIDKIAEQLIADKTFLRTTNAYPDFHGRHRVREILDVAERLRENDYRVLAMLEHQPKKGK